MSQHMQLRIELLDTDPPVWRRVVVDPELTLAQLHMVIQLAMGWTNSHMHEFQTKKGERIGVPYEDSFEPITDERKVRVGEMFPRANVKLAYVYDMGDDWVHAITFEKRAEPPAQGSTQGEPPAAALLDGARACPPEDCGGIPGYYDILDLLSKRKSADDDEHERLERLGDWRPERFDPATARRALAKMRVKQPAKKKVGKKKPNKKKKKATRVWRLRGT